MKTLLLFSTLFILVSANSQMAVTDPGNTAINQSNLVKNTAILAKAGQTLNETKKQVKFLVEAKEAIEKVSNAVRDINNIQAIIKLQTSLLSNANNSLQKIKSSGTFSANEIANITSTLAAAVAQSNKTVELVNKLISDNLFKMKDAERLKLLKDAENEMQNVHTNVKYFTQRYRRIMSLRLIKKKAN